MNGFNDFALARALHVLAVVVWIGGVAFVTAVLLPACRDLAEPAARIDLFERLEHRFAAIARGAVLLAGASGLYLVWRLDLWSRFAQPADWWWMHAMVGVWTVFALMLFVLEPLVLHKLFRRLAEADPEATFARIQRLHVVLLAASVVTVIAHTSGSAPPSILYQNNPTSCAAATFPSSAPMTAIGSDPEGDGFSGIIPAFPIGTHVCWKLAVPVCGVTAASVAGAICTLASGWNRQVVVTPSIVTAQPSPARTAMHRSPSSAASPATTLAPAGGAFALLALLTLVWGTNWPLFALATREVSVWTFRGVATLGAGLFLLAVARSRGMPLTIPRRHWAPLALATALYLLLWNITSTYAALLIPSGQAAVLGFTMPLWAALFGWAFFGQRLTLRLLLALALGALAVALLAWRGATAYAQAPLGVALGLLAGAGWALGTLILKREQAQHGLAVPALVLTGWQLLGTSVPIGIGALLFAQGPWFMPSPTTLAVITYITIVPMSVGNVAWFAIAGRLSPAVAGLSSILVPVVAMVSGALVHGEPLGPLQLGAMACCGAAMWLALRR